MSKVIEINKKRITIEQDTDSSHMIDQFELNDYDFIGNSYIFDKLCNSSLSDDFSVLFNEACYQKAVTIKELLKLDEFRELNIQKINNSLYSFEAYLKDELDQDVLDVFYNHLIEYIDDEEQKDMTILDFVIEHGNDYKSYESLYKFEHGDVAYNISGFSCRWDSGQVGYLLEKSDSEYTIVDSFFTSFNDWANGYVYLFNIEDMDIEDTIDSCGGFIGSDFSQNGMFECLLPHFNKTEQEQIKKEVA